MSRNITKRIDLNELEAKTLKMKADQCHLSEGEYLRELIMSSQPVEAPPRQFYVQMEKVNRIASTIQRICATAQDKEGIAELKSLYVQLIGHIHRIESRVMTDNIKSVHIMERLGFVYEVMEYSSILIGGSFRDHLRYAWCC